MGFEQSLSIMAVSISTFVAILGAFFGRKIKNQNIANNNGHAHLQSQINNMILELERLRVESRGFEVEAATQRTYRMVAERDLELCREKLRGIIQ